MDRIYCPFEVKIDPNAELGTIKGYGSTFGNVDTYGDTVANGAFKATINKAKSGESNWPAFLLQHGGANVDDMMPIGIWTAMDEDSNGLNMEGKLALDTKRGADCYALLKMKPRPALNGLSIGYRAKEFTMNGKTDKARRTLQAVDLVEVSLVTFPADKHATVLGVKCTDIKTIREFEDFLRDVGGYSLAAAKSIASGGYKEADSILRDEDGHETELVALLKRATEIFSSKK